MSHCVEDIYDVYEQRSVVARKAHRCAACAETISPGHVYYRVHIVHDGTAETVKRCLRCQRIHEHLQDKGDGDTWPDERLDCGEGYVDHWGEEPPEKIAALAFRLPGEALP